ncbi:MAG: hypothetical protein ACLQOO_35070 [Terriglobia bacterium]
MPDQLQERFFNRNVEEGIEFGSEVARRGLGDEGFHGGQERAITGKPDGSERPQATLIKVGDLIQGVEGAAVGVTGTIGKLLQFAEDGDIGLGAQHELQQRQSGDAVQVQELSQGVSGEDGGAA